MKAFYDFNYLIPDEQYYLDVLALRQKYGVYIEYDVLLVDALVEGHHKVVNAIKPHFQHSNPRLPYIVRLLWDRQSLEGLIWMEKEGHIKTVFDNHRHRHWFRQLVPYHESVETLEWFKKAVPDFSFTCASYESAVCDNNCAFLSVYGHSIDILGLDTSFIDGLGKKQMNDNDPSRFESLLYFLHVLKTHPDYLLRKKPLFTPKFTYYLAGKGHPSELRWVFDNFPGVGVTPFAFRHAIYNHKLHNLIVLHEYHPHVGSKSIFFDLTHPMYCIYYFCITSNIKYVLDDFQYRKVHGLHTLLNCAETLGLLCDPLPLMDPRVNMVNKVSKVRKCPLGPPPQVSKRPRYPESPESIDYSDC